MSTKKELTGTEKLDNAIKDFKKVIADGGVTVGDLGYLADEFNDAANTLKSEAVPVAPAVNTDAANKVATQKPADKKPADEKK